MDTPVNRMSHRNTLVCVCVCVSLYLCVCVCVLNTLHPAPPLCWGSYQAGGCARSFQTCLAGLQSVCLGPR